VRIAPSLLLLLCAVAHGAEEAAPAPFPDMAPSVGAVLARDYYDQSRFRPRTMVERALRALENSEIIADADWRGQEIVLHFAEREVKVPAAEPADLDQAMALIERVRLAVDGSGKFTAKEARELDYALINGSLTTLDPHTVLMPPEPAGDFDEDIRGEFGGIGAFLHQDALSGEITIERVMPDRPAEKSGIQDGDAIVAVDGESTTGLSLEQAVRRIKGPKGTTVTLSLKRKGNVLDIAVVRDLVQVVTIRSWREGDVGYVRMDEFNQNTARDLFAAITELQKTAPMKGFVLDLRANGGGLLDQARVICGFFLTKNKEIVRTVTVGGEPQIFKSSPRQILDCPMAVLVGPGSASAAEILSGCLQCNDRAVVFGSPTFGKGSVQSIRPLRDGSRLKLTIQEYQLAGGVSIQDVGVNPDVRLVRHVVRKDGAVDLLPYTTEHERDDEFALAGHNTYQHATSLEMGWLAHVLDKDEAAKSGMSARDFRPDQEASLVVSLLGKALANPDAAKAMEVAKAAGTQRQALLLQLAQPVVQQGESEAAELAKALAAAKPAVAWGPDAAPASSQLGLSYAGPATITAGQPVDLTFTLANRGAAEAGRLYAVVAADRLSPFFEDEVVFGAVPAKGQTTGVLHVEVPPRLLQGEERFTVELRRDGHPEVLATLPVVIAIAAAPRPHLGYSWKLVEPGGNGAIDPGEACKLAVTLINDGAGISAPISLSLYKDNDPWVQLGGGNFRLEPLAPGASTTVEVPLTVKTELTRDNRIQAYTGSSIALQLHAEERFGEDVDARYRANLYHKLTLPVGKPAPGAAIQEPRIDLVDVEVKPDGQRVVVVKILDDAPEFVALFLGEDKIDLRGSDGFPDGVYRGALTLKPGLNSVRVVVRDKDEVAEVLPLRLWGADAPPTAAKRAEPGQPEAVLP
jgi:carboxyl-terminal processing protease